MEQSRVQWKTETGTLKHQYHLNLRATKLNIPPVQAAKMNPLYPPVCTQLDVCCWISLISQEDYLYRDYRKDMCYYRLCVCLFVMWVSEEVGLYTAHLSTSGCTDCVWLSNNWMRSTSKTHTVWVQPEERESVTALPHRHTHICWLPKHLMAPEGPRFPILPFSISILCLLYLLCKSHFSLSLCLQFSLVYTHKHTHTSWQRHINTLCVNVIFPRLPTPWGGTGGIVFSSSEQTAV